MLQTLQYGGKSGPESRRTRRSEADGMLKFNC